MKRVTLALALAALAAAILAPLAAARVSTTAATTKVTVLATDFKFKLSKTKVPTGTIVFTLVNKGKLPHDFKIAGKKTKLLSGGQSATLTVNLAKGSYPYMCTVPGHAAAGMKGTFTVS